MTPSQRKKYRIEFLKEVYDHEFNNNGEPYKISISKEDENSEKHLAIKYLMGSEYIVNLHSHYNNYTLSITNKGIDLIEELF